MRRAAEIDDVIPDTLLTPEQVGREYDIPVITLMVWREQGTGPRCFRLGGRLVYRCDEISAWIAANGTVTPAQSVGSTNRPDLLVAGRPGSAAGGANAASPAAPALSDPVLLLRAVGQSRGQFGGRRVGGQLAGGDQVAGDEDFSAATSGIDRDRGHGKSGWEGTGLGLGGLFGVDDVVGAGAPDAAVQEGEVLDAGLTPNMS